MKKDLNYKTHSTANNEFTVGIENLKYELLSKKQLLDFNKKVPKITGSIYINIGTVKNGTFSDSDFNLDIKDVATKVKVFADNEFTVGIENLKYELLSKATISKLGENETKITVPILIYIDPVKNVSVLIT